jgi:hypothetical protein
MVRCDKFSYIARIALLHLYPGHGGVTKYLGPLLAFLLHEILQVYAAADQPTLIDALSNVSL